MVAIFKEMWNVEVRLLCGCCGLFSCFMLSRRLSAVMAPNSIGLVKLKIDFVD